MKKIAIIDYQLSNLFSVQHACDHLELAAKITSDPQEVQAADGLILPGVGAFGDAMKNLNAFGLTPIIKHRVAEGVPFMGVCLGLQLIFSHSEEFGSHQGLGLITGNVKKFPSQNDNGEVIKIPQIGWNTLLRPKDKDWGNTSFRQLSSQPYMYFVHSFYVIPEEESVILSRTNYAGHTYCSSVLKDNILATQFHPEKSGPEGISIYQEWAKQL